MKKRKAEKETIDPRICDREVSYFKVLSQPDEMGKQTFFIYWWGYLPSPNEYGWRGQIFKANLNYYIRKVENEGKKICILN